MGPPSIPIMNLRAHGILQGAGPASILLHCLKSWKMMEQGGTVGRRGGGFNSWKGNDEFTAEQGNKAPNMNNANGWRRVLVIPAVLLGISTAVSGAAVSFPGAAWAQLSDQDTTSTRGTQFIRPPPVNQ